MAKNTQRTMPVLPLRDVVVFPYMVMPLFVGRAKSINALEEAMNDDKQLLLVSQREADLKNLPLKIYLTWVPLLILFNC